YESNNRTGIWSSPTILSQGFGSAIRPAGALDAGGRLHFVWSDLQQARQIFYTRVDRFDWIKVVNEGGLAMSAAQIYRNGHLLGETDERGLFFADALAVDDELVTLAPVDEYAGVRQGHTSPDSPTRDWAYRTYLTNWRYAAGGERVGATVANLEGEQLLQVRSDSPLALLNLVVSMEWGASMTETQRFSNALHSASDYLFDATNGQIAIGHAAIYTRGDWWADADIQVLATNYNRPHAQVGGLREPLSAPIRVGRQWSGTLNVISGEATWDKPAGYRTLVHELGHHVLGLGDSYLGPQFNITGTVTGWINANCTAPDIRINEQDDVNATLMDYQYNASEFAMRGVIGAWTDDCVQTKQWYFNQESDWETIARLFDGAAADNTWQFQTPAQTGILAGPSSLPLNGLPLVAIVEDDGEAAIETTVQLEGPPSVIQAASVTLFAQRGPDHTEAIDQGFSDRNGRIVVLGGRAGDEVRALSWNATYAGKVTLQAGVTNTLVMTTITPA
ncbi:MAG: hypothetical protein KDD84_24075, partial [Caldilineaceae bacterium]|nr:hypothetical protein [Caldilineaceae bacterium]